LKSDISCHIDVLLIASAVIRGTYLFSTKQFLEHCIQNSFLAVKSYTRFGLALASIIIFESTFYNSLLNVSIDIDIISAWFIISFT